MRLVDANFHDVVTDGEWTVMVMAQVEMRMGSPHRKVLGLGEMWWPQDREVRRLHTQREFNAIMEQVGSNYRI